MPAANAQAGFTRHPIAYTSANGPLNWTGHNGFLGPLQRLNQASPSSLDQDVYQIRRIPADPMAFDLLKDFVVWDCPDMTTWAAKGYVPRLIEVAGLADVIVPMSASTWVPSLTCEELPKVSVGRPEAPCSWSSATSSVASYPTTRAE